MDVQYLIKFVSQKSYADDLCNGDLFMHSAEYYHQFEDQGQGDKGEASIFPGVCIYQGGKCPIYCMSAVYADDIMNNRISIIKKMITDFHCENGYAVVIDYALFQEKIKLLDTHGAEHYEDLIIYGTPSFNLSTEWFHSRCLNNLFVKRTYFKYQKEYRIVVLDPLPPRIEKGPLDGMVVDFVYYDTSRTYHIPGGIHDCSTVYAIADLPNDADYWYIPL